MLTSDSTAAAKLQQYEQFLEGRLRKDLTRTQALRSQHGEEHAVYEELTKGIQSLQQVRPPGMKQSPTQDKCKPCALLAALNHMHLAEVGYMGG